jgi:ubiquinone/menaquinone biosynthesis C-methylase UbiE
MKLPGKQTIERTINYHSISPNRLKRYLDHLRIGVESFPANEHNRHAMEELITFIENEASESLEGTKIMDIGCGDGYLLSQIKGKHNNTSLIGISVCRSDISLANKMHNIKVKFGDMHAIPQKNKSIDTILARHCLEHSPMPLFALFEMHRIMRKGRGILAVVLPAYDPYWVQYKGHFHCMPKDNWLKLFDESGFDVLSEETGYWFAVATNKPEKEWRFLLKPKSDKKYSEPYRPFYVDVFSQLIYNFKRSLS